MSEPGLRPEPTSGVETHPRPPGLLLPWVGTGHEDGAVNIKKKIIPLRPVIESSFYDPARDGVTFSLLSTFLDCREKARRYLQGWSGGFQGFALVFGTITHRVMQEAYHPDTRPEGVPTKAWVVGVLNAIEVRWREQNPRPRARDEEIMQEALAKAQAMLPAYFRYWREDFNPEHVTWLSVEQTFRIPYTARTRKGKVLKTFLRGKRDGSFSYPSGRLSGRVRLFETKTRNHVDEQELLDTMTFNRQINLYLSALRSQTDRPPVAALQNIVRKPLLRQKTKEDWAQFSKRIEADVAARPDHYFTRMDMRVSPADIDRAEAELEDLVADFLQWWAGESGHYKNDKSCIVYGSRCPYLTLCGSEGKNFAGLEKRDVIFRELEDE